MDPWDYAPDDDIFSDEELMLSACQKNGTVLQLADRAFQTNHDFLQTVLQHNPRALVCLSHEAQRLFPQLIVDTVASLGRQRDMDSNWARGVAVALYPELWEDRDSRLKWFKAGLPCIREFHNGFPIFPLTSRDDKEIFLLIARHGHNDTRSNPSNMPPRDCAATETSWQKR